MRASPEELKRFRLGDLLGEGADLQAFAATDADSGEPVVVKRPHPTLVSRNMHRDVEARTLTQAELRERMEGASGLVRLYALTEAASFGWYFGDEPGHPYSVQIEARARGVPLVGSVADMVRGHPIALPLNLFVLHPSKAYRYESPVFTILGIVERVYEMGYLAQDLGPQNVFYSPASGKSVVIDLGTLREPSEATRRQPAFDLNDILFDLFRQYATPETPPTDAAQFSQTREFSVSGTLERKAEALSKEFAATDAGRAQAAFRILSIIGERGYRSPAQFRSDFLDYLASAKSANRDDSTEQAWRDALQGLRTPYWEKYLFDADAELP